MKKKIPSLRGQKLNSNSTRAATCKANERIMGQCHGKVASLQQKGSQTKIIGGDAALPHVLAAPATHPACSSAVARPSASPPRVWFRSDKRVTPNWLHLVLSTLIIQVHANLRLLSSFYLFIWGFFLLKKRKKNLPSSSFQWAAAPLRVEPHCVLSPPHEAHSATENS